jgi:hypothetical protein
LWGKSRGRKEKGVLPFPHIYVRLLGKHAHYSMFLYICSKR